MKFTKPASLTISSVIAQGCSARFFVGELRAFCMPVGVSFAKSTAHARTSRERMLALLTPLPCENASELVVFSLPLPVSGGERSELVVCMLHTCPLPSSDCIRTSNSNSVKRHLRGRHLSVLNLKFDFISDGGCTREEQIALSLKRHLFPHGGREPKAFWISSSRVHPPSEIKLNFKFKTLKRHLLKRHLTLSE